MQVLVTILLLIFSVLLGGWIVTLLKNKSKDKTIKLLLSFSGGFLLSIAFIHFVPEIYATGNKNIGIYILIGFLVQLFLEYFSGGVEHGHAHPSKKGTIPWTLFISLSLHSLLEGIPLGSEVTELVHEGHNHIHAHAHHAHAHHAEHELGGNTLLLSILFHKIPVAVTLMTLLLASGFGKNKSWMVLVGFALMAPIGLLIGHFGSGELGLDLDMILAIVVGMFLHISTTIIFESTENHKFNFIKLISILVGVAVAFFIH